MALTTVTKVKEYLGITDSTSDSVIQSLIDYADTTIKSYLGRDIEEQAITDEIHETDGVIDTFFLKEFPIDSGATFTVSYDGNDYDSNAYEVNYTSGNLYMNSAPVESPTKFKVSYTGGYDVVPNDLVMAATMFTADLFKAGGGGNSGGIGTGSGEVQSEKLGDYSVSYAVTGSAGIANASEMLMKYSSVLNTYKVTNV